MPTNVKSVYKEFEACKSKRGARKCAKEAIKNNKPVPCHYQNPIHLDKWQKQKRCNALCKTGVQCKNYGSNCVWVPAGLQDFVRKFLNGQLGEKRLKGCCCYCDLHWKYLKTKLQQEAGGAMVMNGRAIVQMAINQLGSGAWTSMGSLGSGGVGGPNPDDISVSMMPGEDPHPFVDPVSDNFTYAPGTYHADVFGRSREIDMERARYGKCDKDPKGGPVTGNRYDRLHHHGPYSCRREASTDKTWSDCQKERKQKH